MTDLKPNPPKKSTETPSDDPLSHLHKMSTTAGLGTTDYVAVNGLAVVVLILGAASALSLLDPVLLAVPILAVVLSFVAMRQIGQSNGTQTGKGLAILGMLLALGFCGVVGGKQVIGGLQNRADEQAINEVIAKLNQSIKDKKFDEAYALFTPKFTARVKQDLFTGFWTQVANSNPNPDIRSNGQMVFEMLADGNKAAIGMTIMQFVPSGPTQRIEMLFRKSPEGWKIDDIPTIFPAQQPGAPRPGR